VNVKLEEFLVGETRRICRPCEQLVKDGEVEPEWFTP
jgi:hypothetical protein